MLYCVYAHTRMRKYIFNYRLSKRIYLVSFRFSTHYSLEQFNLKIILKMRIIIDLYIVDTAGIA
jgi:hypothetical protein